MKNFILIDGNSTNDQNIQNFENEEIVIKNITESTNEED